jgi:hypothetical protein
VARFQIKTTPGVGENKRVPSADCSSPPRTSVQPRVGLSGSHLGTLPYLLLTPPQPKNDGTWTDVPSQSGPTTPQPTPTFADEDQIIQRHCLKEWADDFRMRAYCERQQREATQTLAMGKPADISQEHFLSVRRRCAGEWPTDFRMRAYCEIKQITGVRELNRR